MPLDFKGDERSVLYEFARDRVRSAKRVLDCACGDGRITNILALGFPNASCTGIDRDAGLIRAAREAFHMPNLAFREDDALSLHEPDGAFDAVISCHTIEHFSAADQKRFLAELKRVLTPGGTLIIATPDRDVWAALGIAGQQEDHIRELTQKEFVEEVSLAGFEVLEVLGQNPLRGGNFLLRRILNFIKHLDVFRLRRLLGDFVRKVDKKTQPIQQDVSVVPLRDGEKASVTVLVARR
jgi:SAM-dependent methyltransferase